MTTNKMVNINSIGVKWGDVRLPLLEDGKIFTDLIMWPVTGIMFKVLVVSVKVKVLFHRYRYRMISVL